jgi:hypothetical protein
VVITFLKNDWNHLDREMHQQVLNHLWSVAVKCCSLLFLPSSSAAWTWCRLYAAQFDFCHTPKFLILGCAWKTLNKINDSNICIKFSKIN